MSLRGRLLLAAGAMVLIALVVADVATYAAVRSKLYQRVDQALETAHIPIERALTGGPRAILPAPDAQVEVRDPFGNVLDHYPPPQTGQPVPRLPSNITGFRSAPQGDPATYFTVGSSASGPPWRVRVSLIVGGNQLILALPLSGEISTLHHLAQVEFVVTALALIAVIGLGWYLVRLSLRPLADMQRTATEIAQTGLGRRVPGDTATTEVGRLALALNTMLGRIEDAFAARDATERELRMSEERLRRFVADASHELRTPLAAVAAYAELFERGAAGHPEDLSRVMAGIRSETGRMGELVEDLLLLARLDEGRPLERQPVELVGLAAEAVGAAVAVGPDYPVRLEATRAVEVTGDAARLRQVLDNLLANVRAHTPPGTTTQVGVSGYDSWGVIRVADNGPGLHGEAATRVFERFYRADTSRSRRSGGAGLGLAIVAAIVAAHGGRVAVTDTSGGGATFTIWLPLASRPSDGPPASGEGASVASSGATQ